MTHPRALRLQFSLRLLLLAFTAFAIGFPIWYRWPFEVETEQRDPSTGALQSRRVSTLQRQWGGGRVLHGPSRHTYGNMVVTSHYRQGIMHGPYTVRHAKGHQSQTGQYVNGQKAGTWVETVGKDTFTTTWHKGGVHGTMEFPARRNEKATATFDAGRLTHFNGQPVEDWSFAALDLREIDPRTAAELQRTTQINVVEMPLRDTLVYLSDVHRIPILIDTEAGLQADMPVSGNYGGLTLQAALTLLAVPNDLACDYRFGCLWITTAESAKAWRDLTGISDITPLEGSTLSRAWNATALNVDVANIPLADVVAYLAQPLNITIDTTKVAPSTDEPARLAVTHYSRDLPFRHVLGQLLYKTGCRCQLEGDKLVILPPETNSK